MKTLVLATHGFAKKPQKVPQKEFDRTERIRQEYFKAKEIVMAKREIKFYSLTEMKDKYIGKVGTKEHGEYEYLHLM